MTTKTISLNTIVDVKEFVNTVARYDFEVDLVSGRYHIDGKSIMFCRRINCPKEKLRLPCFRDGLFLFKSAKKPQSNDCGFSSFRKLI